MVLVYFQLIYVGTKKEKNSAYRGIEIHCLIFYLSFQIIVGGSYVKAMTITTNAMTKKYF